VNGARPGLQAAGSARPHGPALRRFLLPGLLCLVLTPAGPVAAAPSTAGWVEPVRIVEAGIALPAKLDSGAAHSSLHAERVLFSGSGDAMRARFEVTGPGGARVTLERPVVRMARIKRHGAAPQLRPVVRLTLCIGTARREVEVNLVDRSGFDYPLLLGRSFLRGLVVIDVDRQYLTEPACALAG
jgi:hypothetical protein